MPLSSFDRMTVRNSNSRFETILEKHFTAELAGNPAAAAFAGLKEGEGKLGSASPQHHEKRRQRLVRSWRALNEINPRELDSEQHLDRLALSADLQRDIEDYERGRQAMDPDAIDHVLGILFHELMRGDDEPARAAANIRSLLKHTPRYLKESATLIENPDPVWLQVMQESAEGAPSLFDAVDQFLKSHSTAKGRADSPTSEARRAVRQYRKSVESKPPAREGSFAIGTERMRRRVRDELGLDYSLEQIEALAKGEILRINELLTKACRRHDQRAKAGDLLRKARESWEPEGDLFSLYQRQTKAIAKGFRDAKALTFPSGDTLQLKPVPEFMRHLIPTAAYSSPGPFEKKQKGVFWVNDMSLVRKTAKEKSAERQQHFGIPLTCAHEAYPGHHLQFVRSNRHPRKWRRMFAHAVFYEGWTLWCEQMLVDLHIDRSPWTAIQQLSDALWRCHRILIDLRLQTGRYSYRQAVNHLRRHLDFSKARAEAEINWYTGSPGVPMSYWLGRLENERLYHRLVQDRGWSLKQFNDWLLSFGTIPQAWIEKYGLK